MESLVEKYIQIINPKYLIKYFKTQERFEEWLMLGTKQDLLCTLKAFEKEEMYEQCILIKQFIDNKLK